MIAVIADDFTGAAEIGGIVLRQGLSVMVDTVVPKEASTDVLIIATDTRSQKPAEAAAAIRRITLSLLTLKPEWIYKKTDSMLRGNVAEELLAQLNTSGAKQVLLVPANPSLKRTIKDGVYYSEGVPLKDSRLADISRERIGTSSVLELLGEAFYPISAVSSTDQPLPRSTIVVGNTENLADLRSWVEKLKPGVIPAGGSNFFDAILNSKCISGETRPPVPLVLGKKAIYVCGSAFPLSREMVRRVEGAGGCVCYMPKDLFYPDCNTRQRIEAWTEEIIRVLWNKDRVIMAVNEVDCLLGSSHSVQIREVMAAVLKIIKGSVLFDELFIEGGATAFSIVEALGYTKFYPTQELAPGVIRMKVEEDPHLHLTLKPGSYQWPSSVWQFASPPILAEGS